MFYYKVLFYVLSFNLFSRSQKPSDELEEVTAKYNKLQKKFLDIVLENERLNSLEEVSIYHSLVIIIFLLR